MPRRRDQSCEREDAALSGVFQVIKGGIELWSGVSELTTLWNDASSSSSSTTREVEAGLRRDDLRHPASSSKEKLSVDMHERGSESKKKNASLQTIRAFCHIIEGGVDLFTRVDEFVGAWKDASTCSSSVIIRELEDDASSSSKKKFSEIGRIGQNHSSSAVIYDPSANDVIAPKVQATPALCKGFIHPDPVSNEHFPIRIGHYSSSQKILLVGEGDFSFANALATAFGSACNMVATSLDAEEDLAPIYGTVAKNLSNLRSLKALLLHGVDATCMATHKSLRGKLFDCIVFNNPHAGFGHGSEADENVIQLHKHLVKRFFRNAARLLKENGEIHVLHKVTYPYSKWNLEEQANMNGLSLKECVPFTKEEYPGYVNRRGSGPECGKTYELGQCRTFKFTLCSPLFWQTPPAPSALLDTVYNSRSKVKTKY